MLARLSNAHSDLSVLIRCKKKLLRLLQLTSRRKFTSQRSFSRTYQVKPLVSSNTRNFISRSSSTSLQVSCVHAATTSSLSLSLLQPSARRFSIQPHKTNKSNRLILRRSASVKSNSQPQHYSACLCNKSKYDLF